MTIPPRFLDELRSRLTVSDIVGKRVRLTRAGREHKGCCPFHNEKTASFYVNDDKQFYHCFGCGAHGSIIDFVMHHDNMSFPEAVESLAQIAGMQVPKSSPQAIEQAQQEKTLFGLLDDAARWMGEQLSLKENAKAKAYVKERGIDRAVAESFRIGYAPADMQSMRKHLTAKGYSDAQMIEAGLLKSSDRSREPYAFFRERIMFPVCDRRGRVVAFGGRVLPEHLREPSRGDFTPPKYINSTDTPLFHKGKMLYAEAHARHAAAEGAPVIVVEGYLDVIACWKAGFKGAVAPLGTALTEDQIVVLWKMIPQESKVPILCFDGDAAGRRAAARACERILPLLKPDHSVRIAFLPEGEDPDTMIRHKGASAFQDVLDAALPLGRFLYQDAAEGRDFATPEARAGFASALEAVASRIADRTVQHYYREAFRDMVRKAFAHVAPERPAAPSFQRREWKPYQGGHGRNAPPPIANLRRPAASRGDLYGSALLACLLNNPEIFHDVEEDFSALDFTENNALHRLRQAVIQALCGSGMLDCTALHSHLCERGYEGEIRQLLSEATYVHAAFARRSADAGAALAGWRQAWGSMQQEKARYELDCARRAMLDNPCEENENRLNALREIRAASEG